MELLQLRYFCHAAQTENFSKTANAFWVPTSNVSQSIKRLEKELNTKLFNRSANAVKLSEEGKAFFEKAYLALEILDEAKRGINSKEEIDIKICIMIHRNIVMEAIEQFRSKYPKCNFITTNTRPENWLDYDIIITDEDININYSKTFITDEKFVLAYNKNYFSFSDLMDKTKLFETPFIAMGDGSSIFKHTLEICKELGFSPKIALQSADPFYVRKGIELGLGVSFVPVLTWKGMYSENISFIDFNSHSRKINIYQKIYANDRINEFADYLKECF